MSRNIQVGSKVQCKLYNSIDREFYGEPWVGEVTEIYESEKNGEQLFHVTRPDYPPGIALSRREIQAVL